MAQIGAPTLEVAMEVYLVRPKLRSEINKNGMRAQLELHIKDWMRLPLGEISKAMVVRRHQEMSGSPSAANHVLRNFRAIYSTPTGHVIWQSAQRWQSNDLKIKPDGRIIGNLKNWRQTIDDLPNPIHRVFYELLLFTGLRKTEMLTLQWKQIHEDRIHLPMTKNSRRLISRSCSYTMRSWRLFVPSAGSGCFRRRNLKQAISRGPNGSSTIRICIAEHLQRLRWKPGYWKRS